MGGMGKRVGFSWRVGVSNGSRTICWFKFGKNGVDAEGVGIYGSQSRNDFDHDDVEQGMTSLWLTAVFLVARPFSCDLKVGGCAKPTHAQIALLFTSFAIMSIGASGIRPCSLAFGADQFDRPENPKNAKILQRYFNWYYASVGISVMVYVTVIVYIQTVKGWIVGFGIHAGLMLLSTVMFFLGSSVYVKVKANKSMFSGFFQVISASFKNKHLD